MYTQTHTNTHTDSRTHTDTQTLTHRYFRTLPFFPSSTPVTANFDAQYAERS